jgi:hypothetical protein
MFELNQFYAQQPLGLKNWPTVFQADFGMCFQFSSSNSWLYSIGFITFTAFVDITKISFLSIQSIMAGSLLSARITIILCSLCMLGS